MCMHCKGGTTGNGNSHQQSHQQKFHFKPAANSFNFESLMDHVYERTAAYRYTG